MSDYKNSVLNIIKVLIVILISIIHLIFIFIIKESDFDDLFDTLESSPLFDFNVGINCGTKSHITFQAWEGIEKNNKDSNSPYIERTNIDKINGNYFCYKYISYKKLLYNGQIIKKEEKCEDNYNKDCGTIDTLNQHLCIKDNEICPLYDVGIGNNNISSNYNYNKDSYVYYNNQNYNYSNKKIIGKLILNDGKPCYKLSEKLWKKFYTKELTQEHLKCELDIFGKLNDDRYDNKGNITYKKIYEDNLSSGNQYLILDNIKNEEKLSLYSREFLGIDKSCDEKMKISKDDYNELKKYQNNEEKVLLIESLIMFFIFIIVFGDAAKYDCSCDAFMYSFFLLSSIILFIFIIIQSVVLRKIIYYNIFYNCSDDITNEVFKKENDNTNKTILYISINIGLDIFIILLHFLPKLKIFIIEILNKFKNYLYKKNNNSDLNSERVSKRNDLEEQNNKPMDDSPEPIKDLGVPPNIIQETSSKTNL